MKVLQINTFSYKAAGNIMMNIHRELLEHGIDSYVAWGRGRKSENNHEYNMNDDLGVRFHGIYTRITDKHGFGSVSSTKKLLKWIDSINPDIIHLHCIHGYYINIELLFRYIRVKNKRVVWTQHDCWSFTGHCAYFDAIECDKWKNGCYNCEQLNTYPASKICDASKWNWAKKKELFTGLNITLVTPCNWLANLINESFLCDYSIEIIYNGVDTDIFKPTISDFKIKYNIENKRIILGVAGEWTKRKGLQDFVKLNEFIDKEKYVIVVVGVTKKQIHNLPTDMISITRTESLKELAEIYSSSFVYFNPTYEDNFPTTNLEALACGVPVVTYDTGGSPEALENKSCVLKKGDFRAIEKIINEGVPQNVSLKSSFSIISMIRQYIDLYDRVFSKD